jgi:hypothetical protein
MGIQDQNSGTAPYSFYCSCSKLVQCAQEGADAVISSLTAILPAVIPGGCCISKYHPQMVKTCTFWTRRQTIHNCSFGIAPTHNPKYCLINDVDGVRLMHSCTLLSCEDGDVATMTSAYNHINACRCITLISPSSGPPPSLILQLSALIRHQSAKTA